MKTLLLLDVETSGLDPAVDHLLEVGVVLWSVEHRSTIESASWLAQAPCNPAQAINGIAPALVAASTLSRGDLGMTVQAWAKEADAVLAHNGDFDRQWLPDLGKPWIDTAFDLDWPRPCTDRKLTALALAHGLAVLEAHRALPDCQLLARLLERVGELGHDVAAMLALAMRPKVRVVALSPRFDAAKNQLFKEAGFRWSPERKEWWRMLAADDVDALPFRVLVER